MILKRHTATNVEEASIEHVWEHTYGCTLCRRNVMHDAAGDEGWWCQAKKSGKVLHKRPDHFGFGCNVLFILGYPLTPIE